VVQSQVSPCRIYKEQSDTGADFSLSALPVVLYGYGTWSLTLREEHRLRVFENGVLERITGPKREEVVGGRRRLHPTISSLLVPNILLSTLIQTIIL
jgi:hypothetical protein